MNAVTWRCCWPKIEGLDDGMIPLEVTIVAATFGVLVAFGVVVVGLARPGTSVANARRRVADALKLRPWPHRAVIWAALFVLIVNICGVMAAATNNLLVTACCLVAAFIALAAAGLALRRR